MVADFLKDQELLHTEGGSGLAANPDEWDRRAPLGVTCASLAGGRRPLARACIDWTARRYHLAGSLGAALAQAMIDRGWIQRVREGERAVRVTDDGAAGLSAVFGIDMRLLLVAREDPAAVGSGEPGVSDPG